MTPREMARQAAALVDRLEREQMRRLLALLKLVEDDALTLIRRLDLSDTSTARVVRELRARQAVEQSQAAQRLLSLGRADGPLVPAFRADVLRAMEDGARTAQAAAVSTGVVTTAEAAAVAAFGTRVDLELVDAITRTTLTTLARVSSDGRARLEEAIVRGAIRGAGPRATARLAREAIDVTRYEAERIVRTVFMSANNEARDAQYARLGVTYVQWDATNDARTCPYCAARHGMVYARARAPRAPAHPFCRCVHLPWRADSAPENRGDAYYERTRAEMRDRLTADGKSPSTATATAPFERANGTPPPAPVWAPGRGFL